MRHPVLIAVVAMSALSAGAALADDDCDAPMADWQPRGAVQRMAESKGWAVRRIKTDDGCYEIKGRDADGDEIEAKVHPVTLEILEIEIEEGDDDDDEGAADSSVAAPETQDAAPVLSPAPKNRLIQGNGKPSAVVE